GVSLVPGTNSTGSRVLVSRRSQVSAGASVASGTESVRPESPSAGAAASRAPAVAIQATAELRNKAPICSIGPSPEEEMRPMATAEGTLVASYNRGMRLVYEAGGVTTTIMDDRMQRAPAFLLPSAREARDFCGWLGDNFDDIKAAAETTTKSGKLIEIERYTA